jgi:hypothetical protein
MTPRITLLVLLALVAGAPVTAQVSTDRPGLGFNPATVGRGAFQIEAGLPQATLLGDDATAYTVPVALRYGITPAIEVRASSSVFDATEIGGETESGLGFSAITAGVKVAVPAGSVALGVIPEVVIPTEGDGDVVFQVNAPAGFTVGDFGLTLVPGLVTGNGATVLNAVAVLGRSFGSGLSGYAEVGAFPLLDGDGETPVLAGAGVAVLLNEDTQLDAFFDAGLTDAAPDLVVGIGASFRID